MVRAPCCEKMGLKKGPWTAAEDQVLVAHIESHGHGNWRALPRLAGLLRCGKSCRLRWMNYLRPDIKRGNFSKEEEDAIIHLHRLLGNRWSAIAAKLPGRTDNEIKNVWHTHLKKRAKPGAAAASGDLQAGKWARRGSAVDAVGSKPVTLQKIEPSAAAAAADRRLEDASPGPTSPPQHSCSEFSSSGSAVDVCSTPAAASAMIGEHAGSSDTFLDADDERFWSEALSTLEEYSDVGPVLDFETPYGSLPPDHVGVHRFHASDALAGDDDGGDVDFWLRVFMLAGGQPHSPDF